MKWLHTSVFLPAESREYSNLMGYSPWGRRVRHDWVTEHTHTYSTIIYLEMHVIKKRLYYIVLFGAHHVGKFSFIINKSIYIFIWSNLLMNKWNTWRNSLHHFLHSVGDAGLYLCYWLRSPMCFPLGGVLADSSQLNLCVKNTDTEKKKLKSG